MDADNATQATADRPHAASAIDQWEQSSGVIRSHTLWALGAGLIPVPLFDMAAVTGVQMDMLKQLARIYDVDYSAEAGKTFAGALTGSLFAFLGASAVKAIPGLGTFLGGGAMSLMSGASTFAAGKVAQSYFASGVSIADIDVREARSRYRREYKRARRHMDDLLHETESDVYRATMEDLAKAHELHAQGVLTDDEFDHLKRRLLERLNGGPEKPQAGQD